MKAFCIGMHRSGTSLLARLINLMGVSLGAQDALLLPKPDNPKGFWENQEAMELNDALLSLAGAAWNRPERFRLDRLPAEGLTPLRQRAERLLDNFNSEPDWLLKDPRLCLTLPVWLQLAPRPVIVHAVRHPLRVALSLHRRDRLPLHHGLALWEHYTAAALRNSQGLPCLFVEFQALAQSYPSEMARILGYLRSHGAAVSAPDEAAVSAFLDYAPHRIAPPLRSSLLSPEQEQLWRDLTAAASGGPNPEPRLVSAAAQDILRAGSRTLLAAARLRDFAGHVPPEEAEARLEMLQQEHTTALGEQAATLGKEHAEALALQAETFRQERDKALEFQADALAKEHARNIESREYALRTTFQANFAEQAREHERCMHILEQNIARQGTAFRALQSQAIAAGELAQTFEAEVKRNEGELARALAGQDALRGMQREAEEEAREAQARNERDIWALQNWLEQSGEAAQALSRSWSWRLGNLPARLGGALLGRSVDSALTHLSNINRDFLDWRHQHNPANSWHAAPCQPTGLPDLLRGALAAPGLALRLLSLERVINFWRTLRCHDKDQRARIFRHYIELFSGASRSTAATLPTPVGMQPVPHVEHPEVSIIIPAYNQWAFTRSCIRSILYSGTLVPYEILLADDASTDETRRAAELFPGLVVVRGEENLGFLRNGNRCARRARAPFLLFLNNDTEVQGDWLGPLHQLMTQDRSIAICGSKLVYPDGTLQEAGGIIWSDGSGWNYGRHGDPEAPQYNYVKDADYISGASILVRRDFWERVGGFDERYAPAYFEDTDLAFKAREQDLRVVYHPQSVVVHHEGKSHGTDTAAGVKQHQVRNRETFVRRWTDKLAAEHFPNGDNVFLARDRSRGKRTVLVIDHYVPHFDQDAGSKATFQYMRLLLKAGYAVKFLGDNFFRHEPYTSVLQRIGVEVLYGDEMARNWRTWLAENGHHLDAVLLNRPHITEKFLDACRQNTSARLLYCGHDLHHLRKQREYELSGLRQDLEEALRWEQLESRIFHAVDVVLTFSSMELDLLRRRYPEVASAHIPLYAYEELPHISGGYDTRSDLFFVGGFGHPPNLDGVSWFLDEVFPLVLERCPGAVFWCAGSKMPEALLRRKSSNVRILGRLTEEELSRQLGVRRVNVVPLRYGAGVKGKVVEALASGMLLAATGIALEGLPGIAACCPACDSAEALAAEICRLLWLEPSECEVLAIRGREYAWGNFSERAAAEALLPVIGCGEPLARFLDRLE
ncbi:glycosyltransferase [Humidesulfovibrio idahonensis]